MVTKTAPAIMSQCGKSIDNSGRSIYVSFPPLGGVSRTGLGECFDGLPIKIGVWAGPSIDVGLAKLTFEAAARSLSSEAFEWSDSQRRTAGKRI